MKFDGFDDFDFDRDREAGAGVEIEVAPDKFMTIRREGGANRAYSRTVARLVEPFQALILAKKLTDEQWEEVQMRAYAEAIVIGWRGFTSGGEPVPFTADNVEAFFKAYPNRFEFVVSQANAMGNFKRQTLEDAAKN